MTTMPYPQSREHTLTHGWLSRAAESAQSRLSAKDRAIPPIWWEAVAIRYSSDVRKWPRAN